jgi:hypothetical protein
MSKHRDGDAQDAAGFEANVLGFVRGEANLSALQGEHLRVQVTPSGVSVEYRGQEDVVPELTDIATGFRKLLQRDRHERGSWAQVLLAGAAFLDLAALESGVHGQILLDALWDVADGQEVGEEARRVISQLSGEPA